ncbi:hypothetical protein BD289DRAFT_160607 [Coniella lustricola]|uniref:Uncharacterized protein n=1 Tax=Coniella lustricola TaxID=2025994 RepID=A0A2T2ZUI4_9PEZI|nr:hypothetical protein BD289DRAFT_160607 [Coniella lustricola]
MLKTLDPPRQVSGCVVCVCVCLFSRVASVLWVFLSLFPSPLCQGPSTRIGQFMMRSKGSAVKPEGEQRRMPKNIGTGGEISGQCASTPSRGVLPDCPGSLHVCVSPVLYLQCHHGPLSLVSLNVRDESFFPFSFFRAWRRAKLGVYYMALSAPATRGMIPSARPTRRQLTRLTIACRSSQHNSLFSARSTVYIAM